MSFEHGSFTVSFFELPVDLPADYLERFAGLAAGTLDSVTDELQVGWVSGRHLLENRIEESTCLAGGACFVTLRKAVRKIPASLLNAMLRREELIWQAAHDNAEYVPGKVKRELKKELQEKNIQKFPPSVSGIQIAIDLASNTLYAAAGSASQLDELIGVLVKTLEIEPLPLGPALILERDFQSSCGDFPMLELKRGFGGSPVIGRDFLTYLWYCNEIGRKFTHPEYGEFEISLDGPLSFAGDDPECNGAAETTVKKGENPLRSAEAKAAFAVGKKLRKAKLMAARDGQFWSCSFDADRFNFGSLRLPEGEKLDADSVVAERMMNLHIFKEAIVTAFRDFASVMLSDRAEREIALIQEWAADREGV